MKALAAILLAASVWCLCAIAPRAIGSPYAVVSLSLPVGA